MNVTSDDFHDKYGSYTGKHGFVVFERGNAGGYVKSTVVVDVEP